MPTSVESARHEWEHGYRRLEATRGEPDDYARLLIQVETITDELRRRLGAVFTLAELVETYEGAERWVRDVVSERAPVKNWPRTLATAEDAAFHLYQRGAIDYQP
jgi:hypothetical protein